MKMKLRFLYITIIAGIVACSDILESDLGNKKITLIAPSDSARNDRSSQTFIWEDLREDFEIDVEHYNLQVASPNFETANLFVLDTNITTNSFTYSIIPGQYQWRVRAENLNTKSPYTTHNLKVDSLFDLTNANLILVNPLNNQVVPITNSSGKTIDFEWERLSGADSYRFQLVFGSFNGSPSTLFTTTTTNTTASFLIPRDEFINGVRVGSGDYEWRITAKNDKTNTTASATSRFSVDTSRTGN